MGNQAIQPSLTGGELAPAEWARVDLARYQTSLKTCRNFIVQPYGGVKNRAGFRFIGEVKNSANKVRIIPFRFSESQTYILELGEGYLRIFRNGEAVTATSIPGWATATVYGVGDIVSNAGANYYCKVKHTSGTFAADQTSGYWYALTGAIVEVPTPFLSSELSAIRFAQSADLLVLVHPNHPPHGLGRYSAQKWTMAALALDSGPFLMTNLDKTISVSPSANNGNITLSASSDMFYASQIGQLFYLEQRNFGTPWEPGKSVGIGDIRRSDGKYYQALTSGNTGQLRPTVVDDNWSDGGVDWKYLHPGYGVAKITKITDAKTAIADVVKYLPNNTTNAGYGAPISLVANTQAPDGNTIVTATAHGLPVNSYGVALVTLSYYSAQEITVEYRVIDANTIYFSNSFRAWGPSSEIPPALVPTRTPEGQFFTSFKPPQSTAVSASYKWAFGAFGDPAIGGPGYPSSVTFHQQRLFFSGTANQPQTLWSSRTGSYFDFSKSNPIQDDDPITFTLASTKMDAIRVMHPMEDLMVLTAGGEWRAGSGQADSMSPTSSVFKLQGYCGSANLPVIGVGKMALFVQDKGQVVRDMAYEFASNSYTGDDLTVFASHLTEGHSVVDWAYQQTPFSVVWTVREDGVLLGMTYLRQQQVIGWHRHDTSRGIFESICTVGEGNEDVLYAVVKRATTRTIAPGTLMTITTFDATA